MQHAQFQNSRPLCLRLCSLAGSTKLSCSLTSKWPGKHFFASNYSNFRRPRPTRESSQLPAPQFFFFVGNRKWAKFRLLKSTIAGSIKHARNQSLGGGVVVLRRREYRGSPCVLGSAISPNPRRSMQSHPPSRSGLRKYNSQTRWPDWLAYHTTDPLSSL